MPSVFIGVVLGYVQALGYLNYLMSLSLCTFFICVFRNFDKPKLVEAFSSAFIRDVSAGSSHSAAITSDGELYTWGLGEYGRLGHGDANTVNKPKLVR